MLVHNLPIAASPIQGRASDDTPRSSDDIPVVPIRKAQAALLGLDLLALATAMWQVLAQGHLADAPTAILATLAVVVGWWAASARLPLYSVTELESNAGICRSAALCGLTGLGVLLVVGVGSHSIAAALHYGILFVAYVVGSRTVWWTVLRSLIADGYCIDRVIVLSDNMPASRILAAKVERRTAGRLRAAACLGVNTSDNAAQMARIVELIRSRRATRVIADLHGIVPVEHDRLMSMLETVYARITIISDGVPLKHIGCTGLDIPDFALPDLPLDLAQQFTKRIIDIITASLALALLSPILVGIAIAVRVDSPGPAIFRQKREGENGRIFDMWKFRTMYDHMRDDSAAKQTSRNDQRITRIGGLLRRTSFDELPQLVNVLHGHMSIVGPRPHALGMTINGQALEAILPSYRARHRIKPGITGWAQVNGCRGELTVSRALKRRVALDCHYIDNWSIGLDVRIILRTVTLLVRDRHAY